MSEALTAPDFSTIPVGPLALIALPGCEELAAKIDAYLKTWREIRESEHKTTIAFSGYQRDSYLIKAAFPRFGSGESKCHIQQSVRGYDIFIVCDMFNYGLTYKMYGKDNMMSPDDHYANLKRAISAIGARQDASPSSCPCSTKEDSTSVQAENPLTAPWLFRS